MANYKPVQNMSNLYDKFYAKFAPSYTPQSASTLKDTLSRAMRPVYDKQIKARQEATKSNTGEIVAGMGSSGMGTSTTMQDRLLRAKDAEAKDIAGIESDYNAALYSNLLNRMNAQDELSLQAENAARNTALGLAQSMYGKVFKKSGGGRGYYGTSGHELTDEEKFAQMLQEFGKGINLGNGMESNLKERAEIEKRNQSASASTGTTKPAKPKKPKVPGVYQLK